MNDRMKLEAALVQTRNALQAVDDAIFDALDSNTLYAATAAAAVAKLPALIADAKTKLAGLGMLVRELGVAEAPVWNGREHTAVMAWLAWVSERIEFAGRKAISDWEQWLDDAEGEIVGALEEREEGRKAS